MSSLKKNEFYECLNSMWSFVVTIVAVDDYFFGFTPMQQSDYGYDCSLYIIFVWDNYELMRRISHTIASQMT